MDIFCICRTCLSEPDTNLISIHSDIISNQDDSKINSETQISSILDELTGNKYSSRDFPYPDKICELCLAALKTAFEFRNRCEFAFKELIKLSQVSNGVNELEPVLEIKPILLEPKLDIVDANSAIDFENILVSEEEIGQSHYKKVKSKPKNVSNKLEIDVTKVIPVDGKPSNYQCDNCGKSFTRKTHLRRHMTIHTDERAFGCKLCDKRFRRLDHLKIHENYHAKIRPHICEYCQRSFSRAEHLRRHITSRHTKKVTEFPCKNCEYIATTLKELNQHRKTHAEISFSCKICDVKFSTKSELTEHSKVHNDVRPYLCSECGMRFIRNDYLVIHMRRHTGEKPYKCRFCDRAFPRTTDLTVHERYHTNEKKHICSICGKGFQRAYNLTVHFRVHTKEKPYQCPHCSKSFSQGNDLKAHIRRHTGERYQCELCSASFIQIYLLNNHKKNVHGISATSNISRVAKFEINSQHVTHQTPFAENESVSTVYTKNEY